jgi:hypothetical protein
LGTDLYSKVSSKYFSEYWIWPMSTTASSRSRLCRKNKKNPQHISERDPRKQPNQQTNQGTKTREIGGFTGTAARTLERGGGGWSEWSGGDEQRSGEEWDRRSVSI